ncbi:MAG: hypothetical protein WBI14_01105, partial [Anaerolineaceae bacterium]
MKKLSLFNVLVVLSVLEGVVVLLFTRFRPTHAIDYNLINVSWTILALITLLIISGLLVVLHFRDRVINFLESRFFSSQANKVITAIGVISFFLLWAAIFFPPNYLHNYQEVFKSIRPIFIWLELISLQSVVYLKITRKTFNSSIENPGVDSKTLAFVFIPLLLFWVLISMTKVGLVMDTPFWNVPGIPLSIIQFLGIVLSILLGLIFWPQENQVKPSWRKFLVVFVPLCIYLIAVLVWGSTPMEKHFFSLTPTEPNLQPYPYSDARYNDLGAISILMGKGIYFHGYTDKPLYMVFLAILHAITGSDYNLLQWAQIFVLALAPVFLYLFGKKSFGSLFGMVAAAMMISQQRNAIFLTWKVASVNPKLLMSEMLTFLGIVLVVWLLFQWMRASETKKVFLLGGLIGALSLVRVNPIFIAPV